MNRPWFPFYVGDYLADTGHLTTEQHGAYLLLLIHCWQFGKLPASKMERAALAKTTVKKWEIMSQTIDRFFREDGTHKRVSQEIEHAETISIKRKISAAKGGLQSVISRARTRVNGQAIGSNNFKQLLPQNSSNSQHSHKVSIEGEKQPSKKDGDLAPSEALLKACKAKGWVE